MMNIVKMIRRHMCVGTNDEIASWRGMQQRVQAMDVLGIPTEFHAYEGLRHGFGLGTGPLPRAG